MAPLSQHDPRETEVEQDYTGLSDVDQHANQDPIYLARKARARRYLVRKHTLRIDQNRCILSNCQITFRGHPVALEVVHLWPLELGGWDVISNTAVMHVALHPLYDRFAFTLTDDFDVLWARDADPELLTHGLHMTKRAHFLRAPTQMPDLTNIRRHREHFFKLEQSTSYGV